MTFQAGDQGGPAPVAAPPGLVWPPRQPAEPSATPPVREVATEELPPVPSAGRPAFDLRWERDRLAVGR